MALRDTADPDLRTQVVAESIRLFSENGYESTTVEQIAAAAGVSRRTLFRQFRSKEDMIFADHEALLAEVADRLGLAETSAPNTLGPHATDPASTVCAAAEIVFTHFLITRDLAVRRLGVVTQVPALRDRELVTTYRYQRLFEDFLRHELPAESPVRIVAFAAAVTAAHNYLLRAMIRGDQDATLGRLRDELARIRVAFGAVTPGSEVFGEPRIAVVTYPAGTNPDAVARAVGEQLRAISTEQGQ